MLNPNPFKRSSSTQLFHFLCKSLKENDLQLRPKLDRRSSILSHFQSSNEINLKIFQAKQKNCMNGLSRSFYLNPKPQLKKCKKKSRKVKGKKHRDHQRRSKRHISTSLFKSHLKRPLKTGERPQNKSSEWCIWQRSFEEVQKLRIKKRMKSKRHLIRLKKSESKCGFSSTQFTNGKIKGDFY